MTITEPIFQKYCDNIPAKLNDLPGSLYPWVRAFRKHSVDTLQKVGLPTRQVEKWKYTDLRTLFRSDFSSQVQGFEISEDVVAPFRVEGAIGIAVFVDGYFSPSFSSLTNLPSGLKIKSLAGMLENGDPLLETQCRQVTEDEGVGLIALNSAMMQDGVFISIDDGASIDAPIQVMFVTTDGFAKENHLRNTIVAGNSSSATIVESYIGIGEASGFTNVINQISMGANTNLKTVKFQIESSSAFHISLSNVQILQDSQFESCVFSLGARIARNEIKVQMNGEGSGCRLNGLALARDRQHCDNITDIKHSKGLCQSDQLYKGVLDNNARSVFQGRIFVAEHSQKTDARQMNRNLLLSKGAEADSKPELIIHADDVKCGHGATVGDLDNNVLFYMRSRGISEIEARRLLIEAFAKEAFEEIADQGILNQIDIALTSWLSHSSVEKKVA